RRRDRRFRKLAAMLRPLRRMGCVGQLLLVLVVVVGITAVLQPWAFHIGGRWTPLSSWQGVGRLVDSAGRPYGLYLFFTTDLRHMRGFHVAPGKPTPQFNLR